MREKGCALEELQFSEGDKTYNIACLKIEGSKSIQGRFLEKWMPVEIPKGK